MIWQIEFPDFAPADMPTIPAAFADISWHNDVCPSFRHDDARAVLFVDYAKAELREFPEAERFSVHRIDADGLPVRVLATSNDWRAVSVVLVGEMFRDNVRFEVGHDADTLAAIDNENVRRGMDSGTCATHDYCDANEPMNAAFLAMFGRDVDGDSDDDSKLWSDAWDYAKRAGFATEGTDA